MKESRFIVDKHSDDHPAILAWNNVKPPFSMPGRIELLVDKKGRPLNKKTLVYRLSEFETDDASCGSIAQSMAIIAKRSHINGVLREAIFYRTVFPFLSISSADYYGYFVDNASSCAWIFLGEVRGRRYSETNIVDRELMASWLASLQSESGNVLSTKQLPTHGQMEYKSDLNRCFRRIEKTLDDMSLGSGYLDKLDKVHKRLSVVNSLWSKVDYMCSSMPLCIVHGDLIHKNVHIHQGLQEPTIVVFDWEVAGVGVPAVDLGVLDWTLADFDNDLTTYYKGINDLWPSVDITTIKIWRDIGVMFRYISWIQAFSVALSSPWIGDTTCQLLDYSNNLIKVADRIGQY